METKTKKIKKGRHFACGLPAFLDGMGIVRNAEVIYSKNIMFDESCKYILEGKDAVNQPAWSKLCGFCLGLRGIHRDSFRFGWRYDPEKKGMIEIAALIYNGGKVVREYAWDVVIGYKYRFNIMYLEAVHEVVFWVRDAYGCEVAKDKSYKVEVPKSRLRFGCGFYFGGRSKAPNDMEIKIVE